MSRAALLVFIACLAADPEPSPLLDLADSMKSADLWHARIKMVRESSSNEIAYKEQLESLNKEMAALVGKTVDWQVHVERVSGSEKATIHCRYLIKGNLGSAFWRLNLEPFEVPVDDVVRSLRAGSPIRVRAKITTFRYTKKDKEKDEQGYITIGPESVLKP